MTSSRVAAHLGSRNEEAEQRQDLPPNRSSLDDSRANSYRNSTLVFNHHVGRYASRKATAKVGLGRASMAMGQLSQSGNVFLFADNLENSPASKR